MHSHLLTKLTSYNSAVFATISTNQPYVVPVDEAFTKVGPINVSSLPLCTGELTGEVPIDVPSVPEWFHLDAVSNTPERLDPILLLASRPMPVTSVPLEAILFS